jgi:hypothetical protein
MRRTGLVQGKLEGDAMLSWQIGAVKITCVVETLIPFPEGILLQEATLEALKASPWLFPHFANEDGSLVASVHALLVGAPGLRLVVDTCIGNDKPRHMLGTESSNSFLSANESGMSAILRRDARNSRAYGHIFGPTGTGESRNRSIGGLMLRVLSVRE